MRRLRARLQSSPGGRLLLGTLSALYGAAVFARRSLYEWGLLRRRRLQGRTLCFGNLTTGGTGKTPAVLLAAELAHKKGLKTVILTRGYGARRRGFGSEVVVLAERTHADWKECGDEPWMMHHALSGLDVPILVCPDRVRSGREAQKYFTPDLILLDDGFQHFGLHRDLDIVMINARDPFGGESLLPLGNLREPWARALRRAGLIVLTHTDEIPPRNLAALRDRIEQAVPGRPLAESVHRPDFLLEVKTQKKLPLTRLQNKRVACLSGIGDPSSFEAILVQSGAKLSQTWRYPDHHAYTTTEMQSVENLKANLPLVTTFKDLPRLPEGWAQRLSGELLALGVRLEIKKGREAWEAALAGSNGAR